MDDQSFSVAPSRDLSRQDATDTDKDFSMSLEEAAELYAKAGHPRTSRSLQRYCVLRHLEARKIATITGDKYLVTPQSVARHIAQIVELTQLDAVATGRDSGCLRNAFDANPEPHTTRADIDARHGPTGRDRHYAFGHGSANPNGSASA